MLPRTPLKGLAFFFSLLFFFLQESGLRSHSTGTVVAPGDYLTTQSNEFSLTLSLCGEAVLYNILILQSN